MTTVTPDPVPRRLPGHAPRCGACGYDTTGLTSLTCPECGADLRAAGITRGRPTSTAAGFAGAAVLFVILWAVCGIFLSNPVAALSPQRQFFEQTVSLGMPRSSAYAKVDVVATVEGWTGQTPPPVVELRMPTVPFVPKGGGAINTYPTAPPLRVAPGVTPAAILAWLKTAGVDTTDPRVIEEANAITVAAVRGLRTRNREDRGLISSRRSSLMGGQTGPFADHTTTVAARTTPSKLALALFAGFWVALGIVCLVYLWRAMRPRLQMTNGQAPMTNQ